MSENAVIPMVVFKWLMDHDALASPTVVVVDPAKGLFRLTEDSLSALRNGSRVVRLLENCLKESGLAPQVERDANVAVSSTAEEKMRNWAQVNSLFSTLTGFVLTEPRMQLIIVRRRWGDLFVDTASATTYEGG